jgi:hypothetical protein
MMVSLWHPLVGVSPLYACGVRDDGQPHPGEQHALLQN